MIFDFLCEFLSLFFNIKSQGDLEIRSLLYVTSLASYFHYPRSAPKVVQKYLEEPKVNLFQSSKPFKTMIEIILNDFAQSRGNNQSSYRYNTTIHSAFQLDP